MIIWKGLGFIVPIIGLVAFFVTQLALDAAFGDDFYTSNGWPKLVGAFLAAGLIFLASRLLGKPTGKIFIDKETGQEIEMRKTHSLFFIPILYWAPIVLLLGFYLAFSG